MSFVATPELQERVSRMIEGQAEASPPTAKWLAEEILKLVESVAAFQELLADDDFQQTRATLRSATILAGGEIRIPADHMAQARADGWGTRIVVSKDQGTDETVVRVERAEQR